MPAAGAALGGLEAARDGLVEHGVLGVEGAVGTAGDTEAGDTFDTTGDHHVALTGLDGVQRHAGGLQRRRAVAVDGDAGDVVVTEFDGDDAGDVVAALAAGPVRYPSGCPDVLGVEGGTLASAAATIWRESSSGRTSFRDPITGAADGERAWATITASGM